MKTKTTVLSLILAGAILLQGCYGSFVLTKKLYRWNGQVGEKWAQEFVFLGMNIIPIYGLAALADAIFANLVEFWSGKNPVALKVIKDGDKMAVMKQNADGTITYNGWEGRELKSDLRLVPSNDGLLVYDCATGLPYRMPKS